MPVETSRGRTRARPPHLHLPSLFRSEVVLHPRQDGAPDGGRPRERPVALVEQVGHAHLQRGLPPAHREAVAFRASTPTSRRWSRPRSDAFPPASRDLTRRRGAAEVHAELPPLVLI